MAQANSWLETNVKIDGFTRLDFDKKKVRKTMQVLGRDIQKTARRLISRKAVSAAGAYPGVMTGRLKRSIKYYVSKPGFLVKIMPTKTKDMKEFYPAFLFYGSRKNNLAPRKNFMVDALESRSANARQVLMKTLEESLIPRAR